MKDNVMIRMGASSGIGLARARAFAVRKVKVLLVVKSFEKLNDLSRVD